MGIMACPLDARPHRVTIPGSGQKPCELLKEQDYEAMPRPTKAFRRQKVNAAAEYKRGNKKEAYDLWEKAAKGLKEHQAKKKSKNKPADGGETPS